MAAIAVWTLSGPGEATTLRRMNLAELAGRAESITVARCTGTRTYFGGRNGRKILTDFRFSVREVVKGDPRDRLTITLLGGRIDPVEMTVPGSPVFREGDEAVLFTSVGASGRRVLVGFSQGVFPVITDPQTGQSFVRPGGGRGVGIQGGRPDRPASGGLEPLERFLDRVMELQSQPGGVADIRLKRPDRLSGED